MNGVAEGMRKAALMLSSLREDDRAWLLSRLEEDARRRLSSMLAEARGLGMALDGKTVRELLRGNEAQRAQEGPARAMASASAPAAFEVLCGEPDWVIALVLRERPWPWGEAFLRLLGTERRMRVQRAGSRAIEVQPRAIEALLAALEKRLHALCMAGQGQAAPATMPTRKTNFANRFLPWRR